MKPFPKIPAQKRRLFRQRLSDWYVPADRPMPWKGEDDPYLVWLSEIMLQQTRVRQARDYYLKFKKKYPKVADLAAAPEDQLMKDWQGLGYYARARNLHAAAKYVARELSGQFPRDYKGLLALKGVGPYTAAAIASFAFNLPHAVVDGNVYRILSRFFGITGPVDDAAIKKQMAGLAQDVLDAGNPARHNQAIMDFGATVCKPKSPLCERCPLASDCWAKQNEQVSQLPVKAKKTKRRKRYFNYLVIRKEGGFFLQKRSGRDIWKNLYQFPLLETKKAASAKTLLKQLEEKEKFFHFLCGKIKRSDSYVQQLTHQTIESRFLEMEVSADFNPEKKDWLWVPKEDLPAFAFPKTISLYLESKGSGW